MDARVYELLNDQINKELYSSYPVSVLRRLLRGGGSRVGFANWYEIQGQGRTRPCSYLPQLPARERLQGEAAGHRSARQGIHQPLLEPLEAALEHEKYVTSLINDIYAAAAEVKDYRTMKFLDWFIEEQQEEEDNADKMITRMKLFGSDAKALYDLDQVNAARVYSVPSPLAAAE